MIVNMRYEYSRVASPSLGGEPGEPVPIRTEAKIPFLPLHHLSLYSLGAVCLFTDALHFFSGIDKWAETIIITMLGDTVVVGGTALYTFFRGDFTDWWNYSEK
jgi:hypothetical protein